MLVISDIPIEVCKKNIKNMHLYVKPPNGKVSVSAPLNMSDDAIERFVRTKFSWIRKQIGKYDEQLRQTEREYVSGETFFVWGKQYYLQMESGSKNSIVLLRDKATFTARKESTTEQRENYVREWYRELLKAEIARLLPKWEKTTGLKSSGWQTKYMTTRWGTCNTKTGKLWFNLQLAKKTTECLEYIILHELCHLEEKNHSERFIAMMDKYMPLWREVKSSLNEQTLDFMD